jgi:hypothetical protein
VVNGCDYRAATLARRWPGVGASGLIFRTLTTRLREALGIVPSPSQQELESELLTEAGG